MKYAEMTDFEINCAVLADIESDVEHMQLSADQKSFYHCGYDGNGFYETAIPDYCNSWADAGPIIVENKISLSNTIMKWNASSLVYDDKFDGGFKIYRSNSGVDSSSRGALRAAMIVFLMMQEFK